MRANVLQLQRIHAEEKKCFLQRSYIEREELALKHRDRLQKTILIHGDPISRSTDLLSNATELTTLSLKYLHNWKEMEERHAWEIESLTEKVRKLQYPSSALPVP